jgi:hypothetical protein
MMARPSDAIHPLSDYAQAPILLLIIGFLMLQPLSTDLYLASLPGLASAFGMPASTVQLTLSMFVLGFGGAQLVIGPLSDRYGRRPVLLAGLSLYVFASLLCAIAPDIELLIVALPAVAGLLLGDHHRARHRARRLRPGRQRPRDRTRQHLTVAGAAVRAHPRLLSAGGVRLARGLCGAVDRVQRGAGRADPAPARDQCAPRFGSAGSLAAAALFLAGVALGLSHWALVVCAMFLTMGAHGINFPVSQSGSVTPFPRQAGMAAGLMGALTMLVAFGVGTVIGASFDGTLYPLALISCALGAGIFVSVRALRGGAAS